MHGIAGSREYNGRRVRCFLGGQIGRRIGYNDGNFAPHEIGRHFGKALIVSLRPVKFDGYVLALDIPAFLQAVAKRSEIRRVPLQ